MFSNWYPFTVVVFYLLSPIPSLIARRHSDDSASNPCRELAYFLTTGIVMSAFALPIVLARAPVAGDSPGPDVTTTTSAPNSLDVIISANSTTGTVVGDNDDSPDRSNIPHIVSILITICFRYPEEPVVWC